MSHKGNWAQNLVTRYSLPLPKSEKTGKYSLTTKNIEELEDSNIKEFLLTGNADLIEDVEKARISMAMWKETNDGEYINIQSKKHLGEIVFKYMGIKPKVAGANTARSGGKPGRRTVKLTPSQVAIAKKLGVPLDEYAKFVKE